MALLKNSQVYRYIDLDDPKGLQDAMHAPEAVYLRDGKAVLCVIRPEIYELWGDQGFAFTPQTLRKTLVRARPGEVVFPGEAKYIYDANGNGDEPLYLIQQIHLRNNKRALSSRNEEPAKKKRRASSVL